MSCINVNINKISYSPILYTHRIGENLKGYIELINKNPIIGIHLYQDIIEAKVSHTLLRLNISCNIVCSIKDLKYIDVSPEDVQWITPEWGIVYTVKSNTNWIIE